MMSDIKILGGKAYGSIPHLSKSKTLDASDKRVTWGQESILTVRSRDWKDIIIVTEKVDGSCVSVFRNDDILYPITRAGYNAYSSPYKQHAMFYVWVFSPEIYDRFMSVLINGERIVGEWLVQAHGTKYDLTHEPFVAFDIFSDKDIRIPYKDFIKRINRGGFVPANLISYGMPISIEDAYKRASHSGHGAIDPVEGVVWRVEREGKVDFLAKYVIPSKQDGKYLFGDEEYWNTWNGIDVREILKMKQN